MNGPQQYAAAAALADQANHFTYGDGADPAVGLALATEALARAALAHVALLADMAPTLGGHLGAGLAPNDAAAWQAVIEP